MGITALIANKVNNRGFKLDTIGESEVLTVELLMAHGMISCITSVGIMELDSLQVNGNKKGLDNSLSVEMSIIAGMVG